jgi:transcriptional antiterminator RfaH
VARRKTRKAQSFMVVQTHQFMELEARGQLAKQGYEVAMPMMRLDRNRLGVRRVVPLFEGYAFVRESERWWSIRGTRGVSHVIMNCGRPSLIADDEIRFFTDVCVDELGYYVDPVMSVHRVGDIVVPRSGRLRGLTVKLSALDADGRCEYLFSMMGREVRSKGKVAELA